MKTVTMTIAAILLAAPVAEAQAGTPMAAMAMEPAAKTGSGIGIIKAIDARAGTVTIAHGLIPGVGWPAMTMTFKAAPPVLKGLTAGKRVAFDVAITANSAVVTKAKPM